jgi:selenocysteine lyase/cysteine desulfurase
MGAFPVDVRRSRIDALATAGHKWLCAGYGAGFCYIRRGLIESRPPRAIGWMSGPRPFDFDNRRAETVPTNARSEMGCPPFAQILALGAAVEYLAGIGIDRIAERVLALNECLTDGLERESFEILSPGGPHRSGETLVRLPDPHRAHGFLQERKILVTPKPEGLRISTHFYNDERDVETCIDALVEYRERLLF